MNTHTNAPLAGEAAKQNTQPNYSAIARYHKLRRQVTETSTTPMFLLCPCGVRSSMAVEGEPSEPCAICSKQIDGGVA